MYSTINLELLWQFWSGDLFSIDIPGLLEEELDIALDLSDNFTEFFALVHDMRSVREDKHYLDESLDNWLADNFGDDFIGN